MEAVSGTSAKEHVFRYLDKAKPLAVELETELTRRPAIAPESGGQGELDKCEFLETWLKARGISHLERHDAPDPRVKGGVRPNLVASILAGKHSSREDSPCLWIMSHLDVVPPGEPSLWQSDPWTVIERDGRLIGRGVEDNQQGMCSSILAALALIDAGVIPTLRVKLLFVADEEVGSAYGVRWLLKNRDLFRKGDMVLVPDSGDIRGGTIEIAEKNLLWVKFATSGVQAHGSMPDLGINAGLAASDLAVRLYEGLSQKFSDHDPLFSPDYSSFQPTRKEANVPNINTIPGEDVFYMDMRILPRYPIKDVLAEVDRIKAELEAKYKVGIVCSIQQRMESVPTAQDAPLVRLLSAAIRDVYSVDTRLIGIGGGTVAAPLRNAGIDSAVWGRIEGCAHQPNEYALIENILGDAKVMALLMLGGDFLHSA